MIFIIINSFTLKYIPYFLDLGLPAFISNLALGGSGIYLTHAVYSSPTVIKAKDFLHYF